MGCCEARDKDPSESLKFQNFEGNPCLITDAFIHKIPSLQSITDVTALELFRYCKEIETRQDWVSVTKEEMFSAEKITGSAYNKVSIVSKIILNLGRYIPLNLILELLLAPDKRLNWDMCLKSFEVVEGSFFDFVSHMKIKVLFYSAEVVERNIIFAADNSVFIVSYSTTHEKAAESKDYQRLIKNIGVIKIFEEARKTHIMVFNQVDPKSKLESLVGTLGIMQQKIWIESLKKKIYKIIGK